MKTAFQLLLLSLSLTRATFAAELPELFSKSEAGFADAELKAQKIERASDGSVVITAAARAGKENVGFRVIFPSLWKEWRPQGFSGTLRQGTVKIESIGKHTEAFVHALAKAYAKKVQRYEFTQVRLTAISLEGDPRKVETLPVKLKMFYESGNEEEYAEVFLNFDLPHRVVQFHEKDPDYRKAVLGFLTKKNG